MMIEVKRQMKGLLALCTVIGLMLTCESVAFFKSIFISYIVLVTLDFLQIILISFFDTFLLLYVKSSVILVLLHFT